MSDLYRLAENMVETRKYGRFLIKLLSNFAEKKKIVLRKYSVNYFLPVSKKGR